MLTIGGTCAFDRPVRVAKRKSRFGGENLSRGG
jgi:hypothetical protein